MNVCFKLSNWLVYRNLLKNFTALNINMTSNFKGPSTGILIINGSVNNNTGFLKVGERWVTNQQL